MLELVSVPLPLFDKLKRLFESLNEGRWVVVLVDARPRERLDGVVVLVRLDLEFTGLVCGVVLAGLGSSSTGRPS